MSAEAMRTRHLKWWFLELVRGVSGMAGCGAEWLVVE